jgi:diguanylate cyclase (GGDEF)-like protein/PAS domain S-box-containing protein
MRPSWKLDSTVRLPEEFPEAFELAPVGIALVTPAGRVMRANRSLCEIVGRDIEDVEDKPFEALTHPADLQSDFEQARDLVNGDIDAYQVDKRYVHRNGRIVWVRISVSLVQGDDLEPLYFVCHVEDVTTRKPVEQALEHERDLAAAVMDTTAALITVLDRRGRIVRFNRACERLTGVPRDEAIGRRPWDLFARGDEARDAARRFGDLASGRFPAEDEWHWHARTGEPHLIAWTHTALIDEIGEVEHVVATGIDITERRRAEQQLAHQAVHDPLTDLPNRALLLDRLGVALARAERSGESVACLFVDLDGFKRVNDSLGHSAGDRYLVEVARRLRSVLRPFDSVSRLGGDEFVLICEGIDPHARQAIALAERVLEAIGRPLHVADAELFPRASIGISLARGGLAVPEALIRDADAAMYGAKRRGHSNWALYDEGMRETAQQRLSLENDLNRALERGQLRLLYQPQVGIGPGGMLGLEALLRWQHPEHGLVEPKDFIGVAEETGLIVPIGNWVLREATHTAARLGRERPDLPPVQMAVNVSARQFAQPDLLTTVAAALADAGLPAHQLCLELTESTVMEDAEHSIIAFEGLKGLGVQLAVDDFGTGYSSLDYLKRFPVDMLKVDRSFVVGIADDPEDAAIVTAVIRMAHALGLTALAEGVEHPSQLAALRSLGCDQAQGFLFSPPREASELSALLGTSLN